MATQAPAAPAAERAPADDVSPLQMLRSATEGILKAGAATQPASEDLEFRVITNDGHPQHMIWLTAVKNIFSQQLPKMPKEYITRLVFDRKHRSMIARKSGKVVGGICYRPFFPQRFAEIVFCAITSSEQVRGYGTRLMNHLKEAVKLDGIVNFLTYADNYAIGYFKKQGFSKRVTMEKRRWSGFIKDYDGGTLMECTIHPAQDYLNQLRSLNQARALLIARIHAVQTGAARVPELTAKGRLTKPGVDDSTLLAAGAARPRDADRLKQRFHEALKGAVDAVMKHSSAWPFMHPVSVEDAPDYLTHIKTPMDLSTMTTKARGGEYGSVAAFRADLHLIVSNCKVYNKPDTEFFAEADKLLVFIESTLAELVARLTDAGLPLAVEETPGDAQPAATAAAVAAATAVRKAMAGAAAPPADADGDVTLS